MTAAVLDYQADMTAKPHTRRARANKTGSKDQADSNDAKGDTGLTIDELTSETGVPSRTIRFYQSKGTLSKPKIVGRIAYYAKEHIERLQLIAQLQDRGLSIRAIRDLVHQIDRGEISLAEWLGLKDELQQPWLDDKPQLMSRKDLITFTDLDRPGLIADLERTALIERKGDQFYVASPRLLKISMQLEKGGIDLEASTAGAEIMRKHAKHMSRDLVTLYKKEMAENGQQESSKKLSAALEALRPLGLESVQIIFGQEVEQRLRDLASSGKIT